MFTKDITYSPLARSGARYIFRNMRIRNYRDKSLEFTLKALLHSRIGNNPLAVNTHHINYNYDTLADFANNAGAENLLRRICYYADPEELEDEFLIEEVVGFDHLKNIIYIVDLFEKQFKGFERVTRVTEFFKNELNVACFINREKRTTIIFVDRIDSNKEWHYLQCGIPVFLPWYFEECTINENEKMLLDGLRSKTCVKYERALDLIAQTIDFYTAELKTKLDSFELGSINLMINEANKEIDRYNSEIERAQTRIMSLISDRNDVVYRYTGLLEKSKSLEGHNEILDFFLASKDNLTLLEASDGKILFVCKTYADFYDETLASHAINNYGSMLYESRSNEISKEELQSLFESIFLSQRFKLRMCGAWSLDLQRGWDVIGQYDFPSEFATYLPNPHLQHYGCTGLYTGSMNEKFRMQNYVGVIIENISSTRSVNFAEPTVMRALSVDICNNLNSKIIETEDGEIISPREAIEIMKGEHQSE